MRVPRAAATVALLLAGCGADAPSWSAWFESGPVGKTTVSVTAWRGAIRLRNSTNGRIEFSVRGVAPPPLEGRWITDHKLEAPPGEEPPRRVALVVPEDAKDADLEIDIAAPPGIAISCACAEGDVEATGSWARLEVKTAGGIVARVERADSGALESTSGAVVYAATKGPTGELTAKSARGDVTVRLPAAWNGQIHAATQTGELDVPPHKNLRTIWDENRKGVIGHVGPQHKKGEPLATVWGTSSTGNVSLRLEE